MFLVVGRERADWIRAHPPGSPRRPRRGGPTEHAEHTRGDGGGPRSDRRGPGRPVGSRPRLGALTRRLSLRYLGPDGPTSPSGPSIARASGGDPSRELAHLDREGMAPAIPVGPRWKSASRDYGPSPGLERIQATLLAMQLGGRRAEPAGARHPRSRGRPESSGPPGIARHPHHRGSAVRERRVPPDGDAPPSAALGNHPGRGALRPHAVRHRLRPARSGRHRRRAAPGPTRGARPPSRSTPRRGRCPPAGRSPRACRSVLHAPGVRLPGRDEARRHRAPGATQLTVTL